MPIIKEHSEYTYNLVSRNYKSRLDDLIYVRLAKTPDFRFCKA